MRLVAPEVVGRTERNTAEEIEERVGVYGVAGENIANGEDANDERAIEPAHGSNEENGAVDGVYLWVLEGFNVGSASPALLLKEPADESRWCVSRG